ncbi:unnamed protein product [Mytilus coruscus]|uniref:Integrase catalytic domain-containing protein n=1 Tax=Mytilus coruscus TaxID=42192 RepID=A0A6J8BGR1_MYTCO|nr:unnamed protein product [Mytilus coruscus]
MVTGETVLIPDTTMLASIKIYCSPLCLKPSGFGEIVAADLHHFADASEIGYGVVSYLRIEKEEGSNTYCSFITRKSRVTPLKQVTIPRLELTAATVALQVFSSEISAISDGSDHVKRDSYIRNLDPILDDSLLRVGGRLHESNMPMESKHPVILPKNHHLSDLILRHIHLELKHSGRNHMLSRLREKYWIVNAPTAIRKLISKCVVCRKQGSRVGEQKMANLPEDRSLANEPLFTRVGVDYFGPFEVKIKRSHVKRYGVIFTCLASRAVHLEVAASLDTDSYINALRRFIARRGQVVKIRSDNGTNFVGAEKELKRSISDWNVEQIHDVIRRWGQIQYMANLFWQRWIHAYLPLLQERQKWQEIKRNLQIGDVILVVDSNAARNSWPMGIIVETIPDRAGLIHGETKMKTSNSTNTTGPVHKQDMCETLVTANIIEAGTSTNTNTTVNLEPIHKLDIADNLK